MAFPSKFPGKCSCGAKTSAGTLITFKKGAGVIGCPACNQGATNTAPPPPPAVFDPVATEAALARLTDEQKAIAVGYTGGYARLLATAGSGKTATVATLVGRLIRDGVVPERVCLTTFTAKAAAELKERVVRVAGGIGARCIIGTFHSLARGWLVEHCKAKGDFATVRRLENPIDGNGKPDTSRYDGDVYLPRSLGLLGKQLLGDDDLDPFLPDEVGLGVESAPSSEMVDDYLGATGVLRANLVKPGDETAVKALYPDMRELSAFYALLDRACRALGVSTFDEWMYLAAVTALDESTGFAAAVGARLGVITVDECQDNNRAQLLLADALAKAGKGNLLLVGDVRQSVYAFRGAAPHLTQEMETALGRPVTTYFLSGNFRSAAPIVELGNALAEGRSWSVGPAARAAAAGSDVAPAEALACWYPADEDEEAAEVARYAAEVLAATPKGSKSPVAVLSRTNAALGHTETALLRAAIPYRLAKGCGFWGRREVKAALGYLALASGKASDTETVRLVASMPSRRLGRTFADQVAARIAQGVSPVGAIRQVGEQGRGWKVGAAALAGALERIAHADGLAAKVGAAVSAISREVDETKGADARGAGDDSRADNVAVLADVAKRFSALDELLAYAVKGADAQEAGSEAIDCVTLSTVHGAKGLEWAHVIVVRAVVGVFPFTKAKTDEALAEEARIAYVAVTRAAKKLVLSAPAQVRGKDVAAAAMAQVAEQLLAGNAPPPPPDGGEGADGRTEEDVRDPSDEEAAEVADFNATHEVGEKATLVCGEAPGETEVAPGLPMASLPPPALLSPSAWAEAHTIVEEETGTDAKDGPRAVVVERAAVECLLGGLGFLDATGDVQGSQQVYRARLLDCAVLVYSSIPRGGEVARGVGEDSIRVVLLGPDNVPVTKKDAYVARTTGWRKALLNRIERAVELAKARPDCPACGRTMRLRDGGTGPFWGCSGYRDEAKPCSATRPHVAPAAAPEQKELLQ